jgi:hypothetical protein
MIHFPLASLSLTMSQLRKEGSRWVRLTRSVSM